ncbi:hypothetical protein FD755_018275 [Muntiacus reevesi]|uniref:Anti-silencing function 1B histone chaperone n=1 Tax=Muntiacus reevesi TaxID=9886 RepID=A0A5N3X879_MUNRE|nr:hypothetical protein FD755_018275 [Muntiacus reevesi]
MAKVSVLNMAVLENPSLFHSPFWFEISFECNEALGDDPDEFDQILDSVLVGAVPAGRHMFIFQIDALGVTMALITCSYRRQEFIRVGYNINSGYLSRELCKNPPLKPHSSQLHWNILASNPRVNCFHINWDNNTDRLEATENQDPALGCSLPLSCTSIKGLGSLAAQ